MYFFVIFLSFFPCLFVSLIHCLFTSPFHATLPLSFILSLSFFSSQVKEESLILLLSLSPLHSVSLSLTLSFVKSQLSFRSLSHFRLQLLSSLNSVQAAKVIFTDADETLNNISAYKD